MDFSSVLKALRMKHKLTQKELSHILGVSESTVGMYERGQREPDFEMLEMIADYFNVDMDYLTGRSSVERQYTFSPSSFILTSSEEQLLSSYRNLNSEGQNKLLDYADDLIQSEKYKKADVSASAI